MRNKLLKSTNPLVRFWNIVLDFIKMPLDIWDFFSYVSVVNRLEQEDVFFKESNIKLTPLKVIYFKLDFEPEFFQIQENDVQVQHIKSELNVFFNWLITVGLYDILDYNQVRLSYKDGTPSNTILFYFNFSPRYITVRKLLFLALMIGMPIFYYYF